MEASVILIVMVEEGRGKNDIGYKKKRIENKTESLHGPIQKYHRETGRECQRCVHKVTD